VAAKFAGCAAGVVDHEQAGTIAREMLSFETVADVAAWLSGRGLTSPSPT
jgi:hypothetical protein